LSTGDILREEAKTNKELEEKLKEGKLVESAFVLECAKKVIIEKFKTSNSPFLLDGYPRNEENLEAWNKVIGDEFEVKCMLYFNCPVDVMEKRILERGKTSGRSDDNIDSAKKRFNTFKE